MAIHIPLLRAGKPCKRLDAAPVNDYRTGEPVAGLSQANPGIIARELRPTAPGPRALRSMPAREIVRRCKSVARHFLEDELPLGETSQNPEDYLRCLSRTTGLPRVLARKNMEKIAGALASVDAIIDGLTRGLDLSVLDSGYVESSGRVHSFAAQSDWLGAVLPSNSPGVHTLWVPAVALKAGLALKPGREEPWPPYRVIQSLIRAGLPAEAFCFPPTSHEGAREILIKAGRSLIFGDAATVRPWEGDPRVQIHGPGCSKVVLGPEGAAHRETSLDVMISSILENGGRSCINASGVWTPCHGREIAEALARRLAQVEALDLEDDRAQLAAFVNPEFARRISATIDQALDTSVAEDLTLRHRGTPRLAEKNGSTYLLPTVVWCSDPDHPLANREFLFPFASVVELPAAEIPHRIGPTLVAAAITADPALTESLLASTHVDRLNIGPTPTWKIGWDQPHEGILFEFLYRRRAFQKTPLAASA